MPGYVFIVQGDLTNLSADAIAYSSAIDFSGSGHLYSAFRDNIPAFAPWFSALRRQQGDARVGDAHWLALDAGKKPRGVVVVVAAGGGVLGGDQARAAVRAAINAAITNLRSAGHTGRLLIALPTFRVGAAGDRYAALDSARIQLQTAYESLLDHADVDVVFVAYTSALYQIFLTARREVRCPSPADDLHYPGLEEALVAGECVLFVGAGLSRGAGMPDWSELTSRLAGELNISSTDRTDYLDVAQWFREKFGQQALANIVRQTFDDSANETVPSLAHYLLLALPVRFVITTNYDTLLERTLVSLKRYPVRVVQQEDVVRTGHGAGVYVVKFHGDVGSPDEIVLCRDDYDAFFQQRPALAALLEGLLLNRTFLFIGYGLRDPNFRQIFSRIGLMLQDAKRPAFATTFETAGGAGGHLIRQWEAKRLTLVPIPGTTRLEQEQQFLQFLDRLSERVILRTPRVFLAGGADVTEQLQPLQRLLTHNVGDQVARLVLSSDLSQVDSRHVAAVLEFLSQQGWRPRRHFPLSFLWERLAANSTDVGEKRRLLVEALGYAERFDDVRRIREQLEEL
jgi:hypothetical protein